MENAGNSSLGAVLVRSDWFQIFITDMFGRNYLNINGRASRKEWWAFSILSAIFGFLLNILYVYIILFHFEIDVENPENFALFNYGGLAISFIISIPSITLSFRRFHDINMSAWWSMLIFPVFFLPFFKGDQKDNRFGKNIY